jgi:hypothetical protein
MTADPERIWLEPSDGADPDTGRTWCKDDVWSGSYDYGAPPTEYVRADIVAARVAETERRFLDLVRRLTATWPHVGPVPAVVTGEWALRDKIAAALSEPPKRKGTVR